MNRAIGPGEKKPEDIGVELPDEKIVQILKMVQSSSARLKRFLQGEELEKIVKLVLRDNDQA